jgi:hypothetical protein
MDEFLKKLLESELLNEETAQALRKHLSEIESRAEERAAKKLEEKYRTDMARLMRATELMVEDGVTSAVKEMAGERSELRRLGAKAAKAIAEADANAERRLRRQAKALEVAMEGSLRKELEEFRESRKAERASVVKRLREMQLRSERDSDTFVKRGAVVLETIVEKMLKGQLKELREDIVAAKRSDFGRRIMEAFDAEFRTKFFRADREASKVARAYAATKKKLAEAEMRASKALKEANSRASAAEAKAARLIESADRAKTRAQLLGKLSGDQRKHMGVLLEGHRGDLREAFKKFLPTVLSEGKPAGRDRLVRGPKPRLELREGNRAERSGARPDVVDAELIQLRKLAGN